MTRLGIALAFSLLLAAALTGCRREAGIEVLRQAWNDAAARRVDAALPLAKDYLAARPEDAAAHYVLGKCYLHRQDANTTLAKGEFETALHYFEENGDLGVLAPEMTAVLFQSAIHRDIALALMRVLYEGDGQRFPGPVLYPVLDLALQHVSKGLGFDPSSAFLLDMQRSLESLRRGRPSPTPLPQQTKGAGEITI
jgi:hypothetical protein